MSPLSTVAVNKRKLHISDLVYKIPDDQYQSAPAGGVRTDRAAWQRACCSRTLLLTQPAASMALAEMERQLDARVFDRERGRLHLNARGRELLPLAQELLERHAEFGRRGSRIECRGLAGELRIGASNTVGNYRVGELLGRFVRAIRRWRCACAWPIPKRSPPACSITALDMGCVEGPVAHPMLECGHGATMRWWCAPRLNIRWHAGAA